MNHGFQKIFLVIIVLMLAGGGASGYLGYRNHQLKEHGAGLNRELATVQSDFASTTKSLNDVIGSLSLELTRAKIERDDFMERYTMEKERMDFLAFQIKSLQGQVGVLEKISRTDPELLQKYSKVYFLNENYSPESTVKITPEYTYDPGKDYYFYSKAWPFLSDLFSAASESGIDIKIISAYRSFGTQGQVKSAYEMIYGSGANQFSADQGYSEHQLGTAIDFTTSQIGLGYSGFVETAAYKWLLDNAYKYGFILSFSEDNQYYQFEPWHWRFVGRVLAGKLHEEGKNFYDLDQRALDQYLLSFLD